MNSIEKEIKTNLVASESSDFANKFKLFMDEQIANVKKVNSNFKGFNEEETKDFEESFKMIMENSNIQADFPLWPLIDIGLVLGNAFSFHPAGGPITAAFNILFGFFKLFQKTEDIMKKIMEEVEKLINQRIGEFVRQQSELRFKALQVTGDRYYRLSEQWYDNNGIQTSMDPSVKVTFEDDGSNLPLSALESVYFDYLRDIETALIFFGAHEHMGYTIPFFYLTGALYVTLQRDIILHGKKMGIDKSYIDGTPNTKSLKFLVSAKIDELLATSFFGTKPFQQLVGWGGTFNFPPYYDAALNYKIGDLFTYPNGATVLKPNNLHEIDFPNTKGVYKFGVLNKQLFYGAAYSPERSLRSGVWGARCGTYAVVDASINFKLNCKTSHSRKFKLKVYHANIQERVHFSIINTADMSVREIKWTQLKEEINLYPYTSIPIEGYNESETFTISNFKNIIIRLNRPPLNTGYKRGAFFGGIEFIDV